MRIISGGVLIRGRKTLFGLRDSEEGYHANTRDRFANHVETGESPVDTLLREIAEELGVGPMVYERVAVIGAPDLWTTGEAC